MSSWSISSCSWQEQIRWPTDAEIAGESWSMFALFVKIVRTLIQIPFLKYFSFPFNWRMCQLVSFPETCFFQWIAILFKQLCQAQDWRLLESIAFFSLLIHLHRKASMFMILVKCAFDLMCSCLFNMMFLYNFYSHKGAVAVRQPYIRVIGIEEANESNSRGPATFSNEEVSIIIFMQSVNRDLPATFSFLLHMLSLNLSYNWISHLVYTWVYGEKWSRKFLHLKCSPLSHVGGRI